LVETCSLLRIRRLRVSAIVAGSIIIYIVGHLLLLLQECHLLRVEYLLRDPICGGGHHRSNALLLCSNHHVHLHKHVICRLRICHFQLVDHHHHLLSILRSDHLGVSDWETTSLALRCRLV
jgi:hypothetical protein